LSAVEEELKTCFGEGEDWGTRERKSTSARPFPRKYNKEHTKGEKSLKGGSDSWRKKKAVQSKVVFGKKDEKPKKKECPKRDLGGVWERPGHC